MDNKPNKIHINSIPMKIIRNNHTVPSHNSKHTL